ncbi:MAG: sulfotransferase domain-containing protein [Actinomycetota bacterium]
MTNELLQAAGQRDVRSLRDEHGLDDVLRFDNCNIRELTDEAWDRLAPVVGAGHTFVVKSHEKPTSVAKRLGAEGLVRSTYIHRDPRDVVVSAYQRGQRRRARGKSDSFARLRWMPLSLLWMRIRQIPVYEAWRREPTTLVIRYEDLKATPEDVLRRVCEHLSIEVEDEEIHRIAVSYTGDNARSKVGSHFRGGTRRQDEMTSFQRRLANLLFRRTLVSMGYE